MVEFLSLQEMEYVSLTETLNREDMTWMIVYSAVNTDLWREQVMDLEIQIEILNDVIMMEVIDQMTKQRRQILQWY